jgi:Putative metallopeptidase
MRAGCKGSQYAALCCAASLSLLVPAAADVQPNRLRVEYVAPKNAEHQPIYDQLRKHQALEKLQEIFSPFRLPIELTLRTVGCDGVSNAWYQRGSITVCYEYLNDIKRHLPQETTPAGVAPTDALVGQLLYVFAHEMGHAVFDLLDVPVLGRPEDAADQFATYIMLQLGKEQARRLIMGAAYAYKRYLDNPSVTVPLAAFSDAHSPPAERFYNLLCMAYGADSRLFADFVTEGYLPKTRAAGCTREYGEVAYAFQKLIVPHLDKDRAKEVLQKTWLPDQRERPAPH